MNGLSLAFGARCVDVGNDIALFVHQDVAAIARVLDALPAGEISMLLSRVGPARQPRARIVAQPETVAQRLAAAGRDEARNDEPTGASYVEYAAPVAAARYLGLGTVSDAANDAAVAGTPDAAERLFDHLPLPQAFAEADGPAAVPVTTDVATRTSSVRLAVAHPPLLALPQRLSTLFPQTRREATA